MGANMHNRSRWSLALALLLVASSALAQKACPTPKKGPPLSLLIVTGGHDYEPVEFFRAFDKMPNIRYQHLFTRGLAKPEAYPLGGIGHYDVVLFYDMEPGAITPEWRDLLDRGRGIVFLHHALGSFPATTELRSIAGGQANFADTQPTSVDKSTYLHNVLEHFTITGGAHPVTCGVSNFAMIDEGYDQVQVDPAAHVLMTSDFPKGNPAVAWTWKYQGRRVFQLQPGHGSLGMPADHGPTAYQNPQFLRLLQRAILWSAGRL
jgi:hypothetical protein